MAVGPAASAAAAPGGVPLRGGAVRADARLDASAGAERLAARRRAGSRLSLRSGAPPARASRSCGRRRSPGSLQELLRRPPSGPRRRACWVVASHSAAARCERRLRVLARPDGGAHAVDRERVVLPARHDHIDDRDVGRVAEVDEVVLRRSARAPGRAARCSARGGTGRAACRAASRAPARPAGTSPTA